jgi:hypothetical protein
MQRAGLRVHEGAAAGGQHVGRALQQARDHPALAVAEGRLAQLGEDLRDRAAGGDLHLGVGVAERQAERLASRRPTLDLPTPMRPTSAMVRRRSGS